MVAMVWWVWGISECGGEKEREIRVGRFFYYLTRLYLHFNNNNYVSVTRRVIRVRVFFITVASLPIALAKCLHVGCVKMRNRSRLPSSGVEVVKISGLS